MIFNLITLEKHTSKSQYQLLPGSQTKKSGPVCFISSVFLSHPNLLQRTKRTAFRVTQSPARTSTTNRSPTTTPSRTTPPCRATKRANPCPLKAPFSFSPHKTGEYSIHGKIYNFFFFLFFFSIFLSGWNVWLSRRGWWSVWTWGRWYRQGQKDGFGVAAQQDRAHSRRLSLLHFCKRQLVNKTKTKKSKRVLFVIEKSQDVFLVLRCFEKPLTHIFSSFFWIVVFVSLFNNFFFSIWMMSQKSFCSLDWILPSKSHLLSKKNCGSCFIVKFDSRLNSHSFCISY